MTKFEMAELRKCANGMADEGEWGKECGAYLHEVLDTFEVDLEPEPKQDRGILVGDFIRITPVDGSPFIDRAVKVTDEYIMTIHHEQYDRAVCRRWFGCPICGKE